MFSQLAQLPVLPGHIGTTITAIQVISVLSYVNEVKDDTRTPYSKFVTPKVEKGRMIPSRVGMLIIYTPALLACCFSPFYVPSAYYSLAGLLCLIHFLKRDLEVLFVHKYSGAIPLWAATGISFLYTANALLICCVSSSKPAELCRLTGLGKFIIVEVMERTTFSFSFVGHLFNSDFQHPIDSVSQGLFSVGILGNGYHHALLANLRSSHSEDSGTKYAAPRGGLFEYVAAPHYLFELITWLGVAIVSEHLNVYLIVISMTSYLAGRSVAQNNWNRLKFSKEEWPASRRNLIPFVF